VWNSANPARVKLSQSRDGTNWSSPVVVNRRTPNLLGVNVDVSAYAGTVSVSYGLTNADTSSGTFGRQFVATSRTAGTLSLAPTAVGPQINYAYAAVAGGIFPGDYIGSAVTKAGCMPCGPSRRHHPTPTRGITRSCTGRRSTRPAAR
jgi:hypothetical protein